VQRLRPPCGVQPVTTWALLLRQREGWARGDPPAEDKACCVVWQRPGARRGGWGPGTGPVSPPRCLPGAFQRDAGGEVAVGSLRPLARQPVVAEVQDAAEVEGLRGRVWERAAGEEPERSARAEGGGAAAPPCPAAQSPAATPPLPEPAPTRPPPAIGPSCCPARPGQAHVLGRRRLDPGARLHPCQVHHG